MTSVFCTLFDSNYLDKGLALYFSLRHVCENFILYLFPFDEAAEKVLLDLDLEKVELITLKKFESKESVDSNYVNAMNQWVNNSIILSRKMITNDIYRKIFAGNGE